MKILLSIFVLLLASCTSRPFVVEEATISVSKGEKVFIVSHGWHTGFVLPARAIQNEFPQLKKRFGNVPYLEIGWGDKGFYQANEITSGLTMRAIFWPTESVVHIVAVDKEPQRYFPESEVRSVELDKEAFALLLTYIANSFKREGEKLSPMKKGIYGNSQFYEGEGNYYLMNTCNKWTAKGLKSAGMDLDPLFKLTAGSVLDAVPE